ncbi:ATP-binding protein [Sphingomonas sp. MMS24-J13]|uniref:ATP-binding protein n=1 Tax=Sphingomonas sp. MMS24-J13 TaxID=3238686 RepID=UPI00384F0C56
MTEAVLVNDGKQLDAWLGDPANEGLVVQTRLEASDRVIARVTDGIYRQPASALRELISNAWDADASNVTILTDAPRFSRVYVRDDGRGMSHATLTRLLKNIGGSAKRRAEGIDLGITSDTDIDRTPGGRPLIGKIGIGLFSISQLSRRFQIITKVKGESYRLLAEIKLRAYSEQGDNQVEAEDSDDYISGDVLVRREHSDDLDAHGTDIILDDLKPLVRDILRSAERWQAVSERQAALAAGDLDTWTSMRVEEPTYHSGYIERLKDPSKEAALLSRKPNLPWNAEDPAGIRMSKLMDAVESEFTRLDRPDLANTLDTYLEMIWSLGLSAPVPYVDKHPFDLKAADNVAPYWIAKERGRGQPLKLSGEKTIREAVREQVSGSPELQAGIDPAGGFDVVIDGVQLKRPIRFKYHKADARSLDHAIMFVGHYEPDLTKVSLAQRGGELSLDAYLFWTGRVIPKENNGVLVRIRGASGALFDQTFFKYQVSEQTRLRQITAELFVERGLDAALNIDRESFNFAHPHLQLVTLWFHGAIRQLTNRLKDEAAQLREVRKDAEADAERTQLTKRVEDVWRSRKGSEPLPTVSLVDSPLQASQARNLGSIAIMKSVAPTAKPAERSAWERQILALTRILTAYDILEGRTYEEQQELIEAIFAVFVSSDQ